MGWIKERVRESEGKDLPLSQIARVMRRSREWPKGTRIAEGSLATYLGHFERGEKLHLLDEHPPLRPFLANFLNLSPEELEERLEDLKAPREKQSVRFPLWDAGTRAIDLRTDLLPPAFPPEVLEPRSWPVLWRAPSGSGRTLVGQWLDARGLAFFIQAETWADAQRQLPSKGSVFIELKSPSGLPEPGEVPAALLVCIAVDGVRKPRQVRAFWNHQEEEEGQPVHTWQLVQSPPVERWLEELAYWVEERRGPDEDFDPKSCLEWLRREILPLGIMDGFETALGFVGLYGDYGRQSRKGIGLAPLGPLPELARRFLRMRLRRAAQESEVPSLEPLSKRLLHLAQSLLTRSEQPWQQARALQDWSALIHSRPDEIDFDWLTQPSVRKELKLDERALQKAKRNLPLDAFRSIQILKQLSLLREDQPGLYALRPRWVLSTLLQQAAAGLLEEGPETWGEALLNKHNANFVLTRLLERCRGGDFHPIQRMLEARDTRSPAWVAALESSFVALGWALLLKSRVPRELSAEVFDAQQQLVIAHHSVPFPRIGYGDQAKPLLLKHGAWLLAAHVLSEQHGAPRASANPLLNPWAGWGDPSAANTALYRIQDVLFGDEVATETRLDALALYGRLLRQDASLKKHDDRRIHSLQMPEFLLARFDAGDLDWKYLQEAGEWDKLLPLLRRYIEQQGRSWESFMRELWRAWLKAGAQFHQHLKLDNPWATDWWSFIPPEAILADDIASFLKSEKLPCANFQREQWDAFLVRWKQGGDLSGFRQNAGPWIHMPAELIRKAIEDDVIHPSQGEVRYALWQSASGVLREALRKLISQGRWQSVLHLLWDSPLEETRALVGILREGVHRQDLARHELISWLHARITRRAPGWQAAWELLHHMTENAPSTARK